jgi:molybdenum cofactor biosynthesis enzyme MoaA
MAEKFQNHQPLMLRQDRGFQNVKLNAVLLDKFTDNRFITRLLGKAKNIDT